FNMSALLGFLGSTPHERRKGLCPMNDHLEGPTVVGRKIAIQRVEQPRELTSQVCELEAKARFTRGKLPLRRSSMLPRSFFGAGDRMALVVEELMDQHRQLNVGSTIHAVISSRLERPKARELTLPVAKDVRLYADDLRRFADLEKELLRKLS